MADLRLPYPSGPRVTDTPWETRRKIAENLDAIADWARQCGDEVEPDVVCMHLSDGAAAIDEFKAAVR